MHSPHIGILRATATLAALTLAAPSLGGAQVTSTWLANLGRLVAEPVPGTLGARGADWLVLSPSRRFAMVSGQNRGVELWDANESALTKPLNVRVGPQWAARPPVAFTASEDAFVLVAEDSGVVRTVQRDGATKWSATPCRSVSVQRVTGERVPGLHGDRVSAIAAHPQMFVFYAVGCLGGQLSFWQSGNEVGRFTPRAIAPGRSSPAVNSIAYSEDGKYAAALVGRRAYLFRSSPMRVVDSLMLGDEKRAKSSDLVAFASGGSRLVALLGSQVEVWSLITREREQVMQLPADGSDLAVSADSRYVAVAVSGGVQIWSVAMGMLQTFARFDRVPSRIWFSSDDRWLYLQSLGGALQRVALSNTTGTEAAR
jgi:WD40 repeat protein